MKTIIALVALVTGAQIVSAASITYDFDTALPAITGNGYGIVTGSNSSHAAPYGDATKYLAVYGNGKATIDLGGSFNSISLLWGSIDSYNKIEFLNGGALVTTITGSDVIANPTGNQGPNGTKQFGIAGTFDTIAISSTANSFELDNITVSQVPDAGSTLALMGGAFAMIGLYSRKLLK